MAQLGTPRTLSSHSERTEGCEEHFNEFDQKFASHEASIQEFINNKTLQKTDTMQWICTLTFEEHFPCLSSLAVHL